MEKTKRRRRKNKKKVYKHTESNIIDEIYKIYYIGNENISCEYHSKVDDEISNLKKYEALDPIKMLIQANNLKGILCKGLKLYGNRKKIVEWGI